MSQLSVIVKQIDHCIEKWNDLKIPLDQYCERVSKGDLDAVKSLRTHISLLESFLHDLETNHRNSLEKFQQKINQVDPVTGERRFGKQSQEKFQHTSQLFHSLIAQCQSTLPHMLTICGDAECQLGEIEMKKEGEMQKIADDRYRHEEEQRLILELQQREAAEKRRREEEEIARLHEKAELIRKRKNEEASTLKAFESQVRIVVTSLLLVL
jgi:chromosome segregation ATPase